MKNKKCCRAAEHIAKMIKLPIKLPADNVRELLMVKKIIKNKIVLLDENLRTQKAIAFV